MEALGVDVGGSGIKAAPVDLTTGKRTAKRLRIPTPQPSTPEAVLEVIAELVAGFEWEGPIGCAVPAVVRNGVTHSAANIDRAWIGWNVEEALSERFGVPVQVLNDADAAGIAENRFGAARDLEGVVLLLTLGTGIGSALFTDGVLVPNTELGHVEFKGGPAEQYCAARIVDDGLDQTEWARRLNDYLHYLERVLPTDYVILGGGISKNFDAYGPELDVRATVLPARFRNRAGIIGAALATGGG